MNYIDILKDLIKGKGVSEIEIKRAEEQLGLTFAEDYRSYLKEYGMISFDGREITGLGVVEHMNVVKVTIDERTINKKIANSMYVIEKLGYENITILQDLDGQIYEMYADKIKKIANSLEEYLAN